jgi:SAM-dependent methyltransferase
MSVNRVFIEEFIQEFASDIRGKCLEFQDDDYTSRFGGNKVNRVDVLHIDSSNPHATIVADLTEPYESPSNHFDTIICTQTLHLIFNVQRAVGELHRVLKPGGVLLVTAPQGGMIARGWTEYWRFTSEGLRRLLAESFGAEQITIRCYGNSLTTAGTLRGLVAHDFTPAQLTHHDPTFGLVVCARATKK